MLDLNTKEHLIIHKVYFGAKKMYLLKFDHQEYYYKIRTKFYQYMELLGTEVAKSIGIKTVTYQRATLDNTEGVISLSFNSHHKKVISLEDILEKYFLEVIIPNQKDFPQEFFIKDMMNLETIWWALLYYFKDLKNKEKIIENMMHDVINTFILQIILGNPDVHECNINIILDTDPYIAPNYDYELMYSFSIDELFSRFCLNVYPDTLENLKPLTQIKAYLSSINIEEQDYFRQLINALPSSSEIIKKVSLTDPIPLDAKCFFKTKYDYQIAKLKEVMNSYQRK